MKVELVRIGNSRGIRIPNALIEQCGFGDTVELGVEQNRLVISSGRPRQGWRESLNSAGAMADEETILLDGGPENAFDAAEWTW